MLDLGLALGLINVGTILRYYYMRSASLHVNDSRNSKHTVLIILEKRTLQINTI